MKRSIPVLLALSACALFSTDAFAHPVNPHRPPVVNVPTAGPFYAKYQRVPLNALYAVFVNFQGNSVLSLRKSAPTSQQSAVGAEISFVQGIAPTQLGFDIYQPNSWIGPIDPRYNIFTNDGVYHYTVGAFYGNKTSLGNGWIRVSFDPHNASQTFPVVTPGTTLTSLNVILFTGTDQSGFGTPGQAFLNNFTLNNVVTAKTTLTLFIPNNGI